MEFVVESNETCQVTHWVGTSNPQRMEDYARKHGTTVAKLWKKLEKFADEVPYFLMTSEVAKDTGFFHYHFFVTMNRSRRLAHVIDKIPWIGWQGVRDTYLAWEYTMKQGSIIHSTGDQPKMVKREQDEESPRKKQKLTLAERREKLLIEACKLPNKDAALRFCKENMRADYMMYREKYTAYIKEDFDDRMQCGMKSQPGDRPWDPVFDYMLDEDPGKRITWIHGTNGCGKTTWLCSKLENFEMLQNLRQIESRKISDKDHLVFNDFKWHKMDFHDIKTMFDPRSKYVNAEVRYHNQNIDLQGKRLWVVDNNPPSFFFDCDKLYPDVSDEDRAAMKRRFKTFVVEREMWIGGKPRLLQDQPKKRKHEEIEKVEKPKPEICYYDD